VCVRERERECVCECVGACVSVCVGGWVSGSLRPRTSSFRPHTPVAQGLMH
jgi:hypothetical protein